MRKVNRRVSKRGVSIYGSGRWKPHQDTIFTIDEPVEQADNGRAAALGDALTKEFMYSRLPAGTVNGPLFDNQMPLLKEDS